MSFGAHVPFYGSCVSRARSTHDDDFFNSIQFQIDSIQLQIELISLFIDLLFLTRLSFRLILFVACVRIRIDAFRRPVTSSSMRSYKWYFRRQLEFAVFGRFIFVFYSRLHRILWRIHETQRNRLYPCVERGHAEKRPNCNAVDSLCEAYIVHTNIYDRNSDSNEFISVSHSFRGIVKCDPLNQSLSSSVQYDANFDLLECYLWSDYLLLLYGRVLRNSDVSEDDSSVYSLDAQHNSTMTSSSWIICKNRGTATEREKAKHRPHEDGKHFIVFGYKMHKFLMSFFVISPAMKFGTIWSLNNGNVAANVKLLLRMRLRFVQWCIFSGNGWGRLTAV